jgi:uracil-DNA glycosylase
MFSGILENMAELSVITALLDDLAAYQVAAHTINQYAWGGPAGNAVRRANLGLALQYACQRGPDLLLIGEAPGYNGARRTGVPFTSEKLLLAGIPGLAQFGAERGFALATDDGRISAEQTATIVYRNVRELGVYIAGWNAYPFHPHRPGNDQSNRPLRVAELRAGQLFLARFCAIFAGVPIAAMGNSADRSLCELDLPHVKLRHPAQGGARAFSAGLRAFVDSLG